MVEEIIKFGDIEIEKHKFHHYKSPNHNFLEEVDIDNVLLYNKISFGENKCKYFICYLYDGYKIKLLNINLQYVNNYDGQTKWMHFLSENGDLFKKYDAIWDKVSVDIKKELDSEPVYNKFFLKTKKLLYGNEATDFHDKENPKIGSDYTCLAVIKVDSTLMKNENHYPQTI